MRILFVASSLEGGAGKAALQLAGALRRAGVDIRFLVRHGQSSEAPNLSSQTLAKTGWLRKLIRTGSLFSELFWELRKRLDQARKDRLTLGADTTYEIVTVTRLPGRLSGHPWLDWADVVHLHWNADWLDLKQEPGLWDKPTVWTLHDQNPFTGACHYSRGCEGFLHTCANCPQLEGSRAQAQVPRALYRKIQGLERMRRLTWVAPCSWMAQAVSRSKAGAGHPVSILGNWVDPTLFRPLNKQEARHFWGLDADRPTLLFVAGALGNGRKGFDLLSDVPEAWQVLAVGQASSEQTLPANFHFTGILKDPRLMVWAYSAADVFVHPAREDNWPGTVIEAQLCGRPVVAFSVGGLPEMIGPRSGVLCGPPEPESLRGGLRSALGIEWKAETIRAEALNRFSGEQVVNGHLALYKEQLQR